MAFVGIFLRGATLNPSMMREYVRGPNDKTTVRRCGGWEIPLCISLTKTRCSRHSRIAQSRQDMRGDRYTQGFKQMRRLKGVGPQSVARNAGAVLPTCQVYIFWTSCPKSTMIPPFIFSHPPAGQVNQPANSHFATATAARRDWLAAAVRRGHFPSTIPQPATAHR